MRTTFYLSLFSLNSQSIVYAMCLIKFFWLLNFHSDLFILFVHIPMTKLPSSSPWKNPAYSLISSSYVISLMKFPPSPYTAEFIILYVKYTLLLECLKSFSHKKTCFDTKFVIWKLNCIYICLVSSWNMF